MHSESKKSRNKIKTAVNASPTWAQHRMQFQLRIPKAQIQPLHSPLASTFKSKIRTYIENNLTTGFEVRRGRKPSAITTL